VRLFPDDLGSVAFMEFMAGAIEYLGDELAKLRGDMRRGRDQWFGSIQLHAGGPGEPRFRLVPSEAQGPAVAAR
jgi:hypothetical protein